MLARERKIEKIEKQRPATRSTEIFKISNLTFFAACSCGSSVRVFYAVARGQG